MKSCRVIIPLLLLVLLLLLSAGTANAEELHPPAKVVLATGEWRPYVSPDLEDGGIVCRIIREAFSLSGIEVEFRPMPWARALEQSKSGMIDGVATWGGWRTWASTHLGSDPLFQGDLVLWQRADRKPLDYESEGATKGLRLGNHMGESLPCQFLKAYEQGDVELLQVSSYQTLLDLLFKGRIDAVICNRRVFLSAIKESGNMVYSSAFAPHPKPLRTSLYRVIFSKHTSYAYQLWQAFNTALFQMRESGRLRTMLHELDDSLR